jgi:hypothetical protein
MLASPEPVEGPECEKCQGRGYIAVEYETHTDLIPCECVGPVNGCAKGHAAISFHGMACPLCKVLSLSKGVAPASGIEV